MIKVIKQSKIIKREILIIALLAFFFSCKKESIEPDAKNNTEKPLITVVSKNIPTITENLCGSSFNNVLKVNTGTELQIQLNFKSVNTLSQYKIDVHNNFDCHSHGKIAASNPWYVLKLVDVVGKNYTVTEILDIPSNSSSGNYHLTFRLLDELGNEAQPVEFNIVLINSNDSINPQLILTTPTNDSIGIDRGNNLNFTGIMTDNLSLNGGKYQVSYKDSANTQFDLEETFFSVTQGLTYNFNFNYTIPNFAVKGPSLFIIKVFDEANNVYEKKIKVTIN